MKKKNVSEQFKYQTKNIAETEVKVTPITHKYMNVYSPSSIQVKRSGGVKQISWAQTSVCFFMLCGVHIDYRIK